MSGGRDRMNKSRCELGSRDIVRLGIDGKRAKLRDEYDCKTAWPWGKSVAPHLCREKHQNLLDRRVRFAAHQSAQQLHAWHNLEDVEMERSSHVAGAAPRAIHSSCQYTVAEGIRGEDGALRGKRHVGPDGFRKQGARPKACRCVQTATGRAEDDATDHTTARMRDDDVRPAGKARRGMESNTHDSCRLPCKPTAT